MPKVKKSKKEESSDSDSGPDDRNPVKKQKTEKTTKSTTKSSASSEEENSWSLGKNRFVKLTEFKNNWYINIREFYDSGGELKPGKKGIMLTMEQWHKFKGIMDELDEAIKKNV